MKIGFVSLGCPKNRIDTEIMLNEIAKAGYEITADETEADIVVINTCAFIESAKREAIDNILDIAWLKENRSLKAIIVTGCLAERYRDEIFAEFPEVDAVLGVGSERNIVEAVKAVSSAKQKTKYSSYGDVNLAPTGGDRILTTSEYFSYIKIADGCDNRCAYCVIPYLRGRFRSRPLEEIVAEAKDLDAVGVKELNIVAQDITRYGKDIYGEFRLHKLLSAITENTDIPWIRLIYCYPDKITDELIEEIGSNDRILKYIDIPVQHISDPVLKRMNRRCGSEKIKEVIRKLRMRVPGIVIRTTLITGFPGETEEDFARLLDFVRETRFNHLGVFPYSREEGTPAYDMEDQIDEDVKEERAEAIMAVQREISKEYGEKAIGSDLEVLCEGYDAAAGVYFGRGVADAPEIDGKIFFRSEKSVAPGTFVVVNITDALDYDLIGDARVGG